MKFLSIFLFVAAIWGCSDTAPSMEVSADEAAVDEQTAQTSPEAPTSPVRSGLTAFGQAVLLPNAQDRVYSLFSGRVTDVRVLEGDEVRSGQTVLTIAAPEFIGLQKNYLEAKSAVELAEAEYERVAGLLAQAALSQQSFDVARNKRDQAQAQLASSAATLTLCGVNPTALTAATLRTELSLLSRINGRVIELHVGRGDWVEPTTALLEVIDAKGIVIEAFLPVDQAAHVQAGDSCTISRPGGISIGNASVVAIVPASEGNRIKLRIQPESQSSLTPGEPLVIGIGQ